MVLILVGIIHPRVVLPRRIGNYGRVSANYTPISANRAIRYSWGRLPLIRLQVFVAMGEDAAGTGEAAGGERRGQLGHGLLLQGLDQDAFDPAHVDEVDVESPAAGGVQTPGRVALPEA